MNAQRELYPGTQVAAIAGATFHYMQDESLGPLDADLEGTLMRRGC